MKNLKLRLIALSFMLLLAGFGAMSLAQDKQTSANADIHGLISKLEDKNEKVVMVAAQALINIGPSLIPSLTEGLKQNKGCQFQFVASGIISQLDRKQESVNSSLIDVARGKCKGSSRSTLILRRQAAFVLIGKIEGIPLVAEWLKDEDTFMRRSAAFAFDELTEIIERNQQDKADMKPEVISATKAAIPVLVKALADKDEVVRCMSYEALEQMLRSNYDELRVETNRMMQGIKVRCSR